MMQETKDLALKFRLHHLKMFLFEYVQIHITECLQNTLPFHLLSSCEVKKLITV